MWHNCRAETQRENLLCSQSERVTCLTWARLYLQYIRAVPTVTLKMSLMFDMGMFYMDGVFTSILWNHQTDSRFTMLSHVH